MSTRFHPGDPSLTGAALRARVVEEWNRGDRTMTQIGNHFGRRRTTIASILARARGLGMDVLSIDAQTRSRRRAEGRPVFVIPVEFFALATQGISATEMAERFGVCRMTIYRWRRKAGIRRFKRRDPDVSMAERYRSKYAAIVGDCGAGLSMRAVAARHGVSAAWVSKVMQITGAAP